MLYFDGQDLRRIFLLVGATEQGQKAQKPIEAKMSHATRRMYFCALWQSQPRSIVIMGGKYKCLPYYGGYKLQVGLTIELFFSI